ncbi:MAG TPA: VWA domain-containing protein [Solirubrobacteraceae bacterium]|nr:VWA domain-containing protein [Solirubrobacteraceae bacterium]
MSFETPLVLVALVALPVAAWAYVRAERGRRAAFAPPALMASVLPQRPGWRRHAPVALYALAAAVLIVAVARPQVMATVAVEQATVVVVTDRSGSMLARDVAPNRLVAARRAASAFLDALPEKVRVGAVAFNHTAQVIQSPTSDREAVREALSNVDAAGSTATGDAIQSALALIRGSRRPGAAKPPPAAIVLLSDGKSVRGSDPVVAAQAAREARVPIYTVALGTPGGTIESRRRDGSVRTVPVPPDPQTLREVAERSGGRTFAVADSEKLAQIYEDLGSQVATEKRPRELTGTVAGGALLLMALAALASLRWFGRVI